MDSQEVADKKHKRLRERIWILPIPPLTTPKPKPISTNTTNPTPSPSTPFTPPSPARTKEGSLRPKTKTNMGPPPLPPVSTEVGVDDPLDVEFDQLWEGGSDLDPDDLERMKEYDHDFFWWEVLMNRDSIILAGMESSNS
jgi:CTD kinase subunit gamma